MLHSDFTALITEYTKSDLITFSNARRVLLANSIIERIAGDIERKNPAFFELSKKFDLIADDRKYALPNNVLNNLKRVEILPDNESGTSRKKLSPIDINLLPDPTDETSIRDYFDGKESRYGITDGFIHILTADAMVSVSDGLEIFYSIFPQKIEENKLTESPNSDMSVPYDGTSFGIPRLLHELVARRVSIEYKTNRDKPMPLSASEQLWQLDYERALNILAGGNMSFQASVPWNDGSQY